MKICVIGMGHMGKIHAEKLRDMAGISLCGLADTDRNSLEQAKAKHSAPRFIDHKELLPIANAAVIATPTETHYSIAKDCLTSGIHVFMEKPITSTAEQARELIELAQKRDLIFQVGHLERFSPAFRAALGTINEPMFIEAQRISTFPGRSTDIDVIMDLMIHDLDLVLSIVKSTVTDVQAQGTPVVTDKIDVANARIEFASGCVASLTASRASKKKERTFKVFQKDRFISLDLLKGKMTAAVREKNGSTHLEEYQAERIDPVMDELVDFVEAIRQKRKPKVEGEHGLQALLLANLIKQATEKNLAGQKASGTL